MGRRADGRKGRATGRILPGKGGGPAGSTLAFPGDMRAVGESVAAFGRPRSGLKRAIRAPMRTTRVETMTKNEARTAASATPGAPRSVPRRAAPHLPANSRPADSRPIEVPGPLGKPITLETLPPPDTRRWVVRRKAEVVAAIRGGLLTAAEACARYGLSPEELELWSESLDRAGVPGLRVTRIQLYRDYPLPPRRPDPESRPPADLCRSVRA
jgi:hypothetical protein